MGKRLDWCSSGDSDAVSVDGGVWSMQILHWYDLQDDNIHLRIQSPLCGQEAVY